MMIKKKTIGPHMEHTDQKVRALVRGIPNEQLCTRLGDDVREASESSCGKSFAGWQIGLSKVLQ
ncbi:hypothetical protein AOT81_03515 [Xylella fastidiosa]|nr:hypothetical protein AOT81_03515 [Xylella fastidiosa]RWA44026.1 hypothetical protein XfCFBP8356_08675 [Xylella fastidiosa subsp. sandyi]